ncbi:MAG: helix-turn-helix domain-containing protein [Acidimicrobiales bacterium]
MADHDGEAQTFTVSDAAQLLGISRGLAYACANRYLASGGTHGLPVVRLGRRLVVPAYQLHRILRGDLTLAGSDQRSDARAPSQAMPSVPPPQPSSNRRQARRPATTLPLQLSLLPADDEPS